MKSPYRPKAPRKYDGRRHNRGGKKTLTHGPRLNHGGSGTQPSGHYCHGAMLAGGA